MALIRQTLEGDSAWAFVRDVLSQGRSLSRRVLARELGQGRIWTYLRPDVSVDYAQAHLNETWLVSTEIVGDPAVIGTGGTRKRFTSPWSLYADFIRQFMGRSSRAYVAFEDPLRNASNPVWQKERPEPYAFHGADVFYVLGHDTATAETIAAGLRSTATGGWIQNVFLALLPPEIEDIDPWRQITD